jgi:hypothetical protein
MRTFPLSTGGVCHAFEIEQVYVCTARTLRRIVSTIGGVSNVRRPPRTSDAGDIRMEFDYSGTEFIVWEPYGDSSRYWIGPRNVADSDPVHILVIEEAFKRYRPPLLCRIVGDLLSLNFRRLFKTD